MITVLRLLMMDSKSVLNIQSSLQIKLRNNAARWLLL